MSSNLEKPVSLPYTTNTQLCSVDRPVQIQREESSFVYIGVRSPDPLHLSEDEMPSASNSTVIGEKCACGMVAFLVFAVFLSVISTILVTLLLVGTLPALNCPGPQTKQMVRDKPTIWETENVQVEEDLSNAKERCNHNDKQNNKTKFSINLSKRKINEVRHQVELFFRQLDPQEYARLFQGITALVLSQCKHELFSIGMSSVQTEAISGEYYADEDHVITGVTCSSSGGFIGSLESHVIYQGKKQQTRYKCRCVKMLDPPSPSTDRSECRIDYWQCPIDFHASNKRY